MKKEDIKKRAEHWHTAPEIVLKALKDAAGKARNTYRKTPVTQTDKRASLLELRNSFAAAAKKIHTDIVNDTERGYANNVTILWYLAILAGRSKLNDMALSLSIQALALLEAKEPRNTRTIRKINTLIQSMQEQQQQKLQPTSPD